MNINTEKTPRIFSALNNIKFQSILFLPQRHRDIEKSAKKHLVILYDVFDRVSIFQILIFHSSLCASMSLWLSNWYCHAGVTQASPGEAVKGRDFFGHQI